MSRSRQALPVQRVLAAALAEDLPGDLDLGLREGDAAALVLEQEGNLGEVQRAATRGALEDDLFHLRSAHRARTLLPEHPANGIGDIGLPASVGAHDGGHALAEIEGRPIGEGLETLQAKGAELHGSPAAEAPSRETNRGWNPAASSICRIFSAAVLSRNAPPYSFQRREPSE